jgi:formamidopyrimidine-DNA glycosylase
MPELPEVQAHAERLTEQFRGAVLTKFVPFNFTALKTAVPLPEDA